MKNFFVLLLLFPGLLFANNFLSQKVFKTDVKKVLEFGDQFSDFDVTTEPMPPGPYPDPDPGHERILCLSVGTTYYGGNILFYAFGHNGNMAASRSQNKCFNFGFYNCRIWWCNPVY